MEAWVAVAVFVATYGAIASERVDRTLAALLGAVAVILLGVVGQEEGFRAVDWNVIFLLAGMMIIAAVLRRTGVFGWLAFRTVRLARGDPLLILLLLSGITALLSAFLDNVTTIVLIAPVTFLHRDRRCASRRSRSSSPRCWPRTSGGRRRSSAIHRTSSSARRPGSPSSTSWST